MYPELHFEKLTLGDKYRQYNQATYLKISQLLIHHTFIPAILSMDTNLLILMLFFYPGVLTIQILHYWRSQMQLTILEQYLVFEPLELGIPLSPQTAVSRLVEDRILIKNRSSCSQCYAYVHSMEFYLLS